MVAALTRKPSRRAIVAAQRTGRFAQLARILRWATSVLLCMTIEVHRHRRAGMRAGAGTTLIKDRGNLPGGVGEERLLELFVAGAGLMQQVLEFRFAANVFEQRITLEVGKTKESAANAVAEHV